MPKLGIYAETWPLREVFTISRGSRTETPVIVCSLEQDGIVGRGEGQPNPRYDETQESSIAEVEVLREVIEAGDMDRVALQEAMRQERLAMRDCAFCILAKAQGSEFGS